MLAPNQGTTLAPHISHSNASAPLAPLTTPATSNQAGMSAVAVTHIEAVNDTELATPYIPYLINHLIGSGLAFLITSIISPYYTLLLIPDLILI